MSVTTRYLRPRRITSTDAPSAEVALRAVSVKDAVRSCSIRCCATAEAISRSAAFEVLLAAYANRETIPKPIIASRTIEIAVSISVNPDSLRSTFCDAMCVISVTKGQ